jgi:homocysteine S-methyltransferase
MEFFSRKKKGALDKRLQLRGYVLLDGALASELERRGYALRDALWSARALWEAPRLVEAVHLDYFRAGADVAITATYQASVPGFARLGFRRAEAEELIARGVRLAVQARQRFRREEGQAGAQLVAASVGPYGAYLADGSEYSGRYGRGPAALRDFHQPRLELLCRTPADLLALETLPSLAEAGLLLRLLEELGGPPCWLSMSCRNERETCAGDPIEAVAQLAEAYPFVQAVGVNCTAPQHVSGLLERMRPHTSRALLAYPNSGEQWDETGRCWTGPPGWSDPAALARKWYAAGARILGGCCRTRPADIAALRRALASANLNPS